MAITAVIRRLKQLLDTAISASPVHGQVLTWDNTIGRWINSAVQVPSTRQINTTAPLTGGGDLSVNRTHAISAATGAAAGSMSAADKTKLDAYSGSGNVNDASNLTTGTLADARLSGNVAMRNAANTFTAGQTISAGAFSLTGDASGAITAAYN